jgi:hypothetical protein
MSDVLCMGSREEARIGHGRKDFGRWAGWGPKFGQKKWRPAYP